MVREGTETLHVIHDHLSHASFITEYLNVAFNSFTGELPSEVGLMTKLGTASLDFTEWSERIVN